LTLIDSGKVQARLDSVHARGRVADGLLGVALDVVEPFASDYLSADEYRRLCGLVQATVDAATEAALATMASELARVAAADPDITRRLRRAQHERS
jgi:hypothetical protein